MRLNIFSVKIKKSQTMNININLNILIFSNFLYWFINKIFKLSNKDRKVATVSISIFQQPKDKNIICQIILPAIYLRPRLILEFLYWEYSKAIIILTNLKLKKFISFPFKFSSFFEWLYIIRWNLFQR